MTNNYVGFNGLTTGEVYDIVRSVWPDAEIVRVDINTPQKAEISVSDMYSAPGVTFSNLMQLAEKFGTKQIDIDKCISSEGCETCDYGSQYGFVIEVLPEVKL